jgi:hypothetical protein
MNSTGNFGAARSCGHCKWEWKCKTCLAAYHAKRRERLQQTPVYRALAVTPWRPA